MTLVCETKSQSTIVEDIAEGAVVDEDPGAGAVEVAAPKPVKKRPAAASSAGAVDILPELAVRDLEDIEGVRCGKCFEPLPPPVGEEALNNMGLPKGWTCTGRGESVYKCNECNSTCAKMYKLNISPLSLQGYSPLEAKQFWEVAKGLGGKQLIQDIYIYINITSSVDLSLKPLR